MKRIVAGVVCLLVMSPFRSSPSCASEPRVERVSSDAYGLDLNEMDRRYLNRLNRTSVFAMSMAALTIGMHTVSDVMFYYDHETAAISTGITGIGMSLGLPVIFYLLHRSSYRHFAENGNRSLRTWGWILSGTAAAEGLAVALIGFGASVSPFPGLLTMAGVLSAMGFTLFAMDGFRTRKKISRDLQNKSADQTSLRWMPYVATASPASGRRPKAVFGVSGVF